MSPLDYREEVFAHAIGSQLNPVHEKIKGFDYHVMQRLPFTVGHLVTNSLPLDKTIAIAKGLTGVMPWVDVRDTFAGQPGLLSGLRAKVLGYEDPGVKAQGLRILSELQTLSPADQQLALAVIKNPTDANLAAAEGTPAAQTAQDVLGQAKVEDGHYALTGVQGGPAPSESAASPEQALGSIQVGKIGTGEFGKVPVAPENATGSTLNTNIAVALRSMFGARITISEDPNDGLFQGGFWGDVASLAHGSDIDFLQKVHENPEGALLHTASLGITGYLGTGFGYAARGAGGAVRTITSAAGQKQFGENLTTEAGGIATFAGQHLSEFWNQHVGGPIAQHVLRLKPGTPEYQDAVNVVSGFTQIAFFDKASTALRAAHVSKTRVPEVAAAELGIDKGIIPPDVGPAGAALHIATHPLEFVDKEITSMVYRLASKPLAEVVKDDVFTRTFDSIQALKDTRGADASGAILNRYGDRIPAPLVQALANTPRDEMPAVVVDYMDHPKNYSLQSVDDVAFIKKATEEMRVIGSEPGGGVSAIARMEDIRMDIAAAEARIADRAAPQPIWEYPSRHFWTKPLNSDFSVRGAIREPLTKGERVMNAFFGKPAGTFDAAKFVDDMPRYPELINPNSPTASPDWAEHNANVIIQYARRAGVESADIAHMVRTMLEEAPKGRQQFYNWIKTFSDTLGRSLPKDTPALIRNRITRFFDTDIDARRYPTNRKTDDVGNTYNAPNVGTTDHPQPSRPTDYIGDKVSLPDVDYLTEATSPLRRAVRALKAKSIRIGGKVSVPWGKVAGWTIYDFPKRAMAMATTIFKPLTLVGFLGTHALGIAMKKELEETARGKFYADLKAFGLPDNVTPGLGGVPLLKDRIPTRERLGWEENPYNQYTPATDPETASRLGTLYDQVTGDGTAPTHIPVNTTDFRLGNRTPKSYHFEAWRKMIADAHGDWFEREFVNSGFDVEGALQRFETDPIWKKWMEEQHLQTLRDARPAQTIETSTAAPSEPTVSPLKVPSGRGAADGSVATNIGQVADRLYRQTDEAGLFKMLVADQRTPEPFWFSNDPDLALSQGGTGIEIEMRADGLSGRVNTGKPAWKPAYDSGSAEIGLSLNSGDSYASHIESITVHGEPSEKLTNFARGEGFAKVETADGVQFVHPATGTSTAAVSDATLIRDWLENEKASLSQLVANNPEIRDAIVLGRVPDHTGKMHGLETDVSGDNLSEEHGRYQDKLDLVDQRIHAEMPLTAENTAIIRAFQRERAAILNKMLDIESRLGAVPPSTQVSLEDSSAFNHFLEDTFQRDAESMPPNLVVDGGIRQGVMARKGWAGAKESFHEVGRLWDKVWYQALQPVKFVELRGARASAYYQLTDRAREGLENLGWSHEEAVKMAEVHGAAQTADLMYNLQNRTSFQRAVKDIFWFEPIMQQILHSWLVKIPAEYGPPGVGQALLFSKANAYIQTLRGLGIVQKDENGQDVIMVPGFGKLIAAITGKKIPDIGSMPLSSLNIVKGFDLPSLSTLPAWGLGQLDRTYGGVFHSLAKVLMPYGPDESAFTSSFNNAWEAVTGNKFPLEFLSPDLAQQKYDRSADQALQYAWTDLKEQGVKLPVPEDFGSTPEGEAKYQAAVDRYTARLMDTAREYRTGIAAGQFASSVFLPGNIYFTSEERKNWYSFWNHLTATTQFNPGGGFSEEQTKLIDGYLQGHPSSLAFATFYGKYGTNADVLHTLPYDSDLDRKFYDEYYTHQREIVNPDEYSRKLQFSEAYRHYAGSLEAGLQDIAPNGDAPTLLTNGYKRSQVLSEFTANWDKWLALNPEAKQEELQRKRGWLEQNNLPVKSFEAERLASTISYLKQLSPLFTGETGLRESEYRKVVGELGAAYSKSGQFGAPNTQTEKDMNWYYTKVMQPYMDATEPLYQQAAQLSESGQSPSAVYDQIRTINEQYAAMSRTHRGQQFPTPEEVFYGNKNPAEQRAAKLNWTTKPIQWLTDFQMNTVGYQDFPGRNDFLSYMNDFDTKLNTFLVDKGITAGSTAYDQYQQWRLQQLAAKAQSIGPEATTLLQQTLAPPIARLTATGFGKENETWQGLASQAQQINDRLTADGVSAKSFSQEAMYYKAWFYGQVETAYQQDPQIRNYLIQLSSAIPSKGYTQREGVPLLEAIYFGDFAGYIPPEFQSAVDPGVTTIGATGKQTPAPAPTAPAPTGASPAPAAPNTGGYTYPGG